MGPTGRLAVDISVLSRRGGRALADAIAGHRVLGRPVRFVRQRREPVLYLVVGGWNTLFGYGEWAILQYLLQDRLHYIAILVVAWPIAVLNAYACYRHFVFRSADTISQELPRFSLVYVATLIGSLVALPILLSLLPFNIYVIQAGYTAAVVVLSYFGHKYFSFRSLLQTQPPDAPMDPEDDYADP